MASVESPASPSPSSYADHTQFFVWREFFWGAVAGAFGEGMMHPIDTIKTRIQSQAILIGGQKQKSILQMVRSIGSADGLRGFYRGVTPGITGSFATGATYFGFIESTKKWIEESHPRLGGHWSHFIAGAAGDSLGSFVYVPCEVIKQRMQVQGTESSWSSSVMKDKIMFYEALKNVTEYARQKWAFDASCTANSSIEGLILGGLAGGFSAYLTTPLDIIKTRLQVQGPTVRYKGWFDALHRIWLIEGAKGFFRGSVPRIAWWGVVSYQSSPLTLKGGKNSLPNSYRMSCKPP